MLPVLEANDWAPTAPLENLRRRAELFRNIRLFFAAREVLEVETPLLSRFGVTDVHLENMKMTYQAGSRCEQRFLQTSPEYAMKRLLAAYGISIYQITKAFRQDESGAWHNPEFTLLEWYRVGWNHHQLMDEMSDLLQYLVSVPPAKRVRYQDAFEQYVDLEPHSATRETCLAACQTHGIAVSAAMAASDRETLLTLLMSHLIEPHLGVEAPTFIYDYPRDQAGLAKRATDPPFAGERFEMYWRGVELANGFHELTDATEQKNRFIADQVCRLEREIPAVAADTRLIHALEHGLPACAGVALGLDRLLMILAGEPSIGRVLSFGWNDA